MPVYVVTTGDTPIVAAVALWTAQAEALARVTRYLPENDRPEYRWQDHTPGVRRLMSRRTSRRFSWTGYAVHEVPLAEESEPAEVSGA